MTDRRLHADRGLFHRRTPRGGAKPVVAGAGTKHGCSFCNKRFASDQAVRQHERTRHRELLRELLVEVNKAE